ncbi:MAG: hypothetical protein EKK48_24125 [Candidatus Melainabacteria bacterium]|nr:MAG: hypothetical protein EKK48_24125 [Candidatus Melainabacteria bacterium]
MKLNFKDYAIEPLPERDFLDANSLNDFLEDQRNESMMCKLVSDSGYQLQIGIDGDIGCAQFLSNDDMPPYYMALAPIQIIEEDSHDFDMTGSATYVASEHCLPFDLLKKIVIEFLQTGQRSELVKWEEV